jgi:hypothetical protein
MVDMVRYPFDLQKLAARVLRVGGEGKQTVTNSEELLQAGGQTTSTRHSAFAASAAVADE